ncbi:tRNA lysidine(34) synthetase TilS [Specibacter cremeus]|uniref:tRNA lysidine(34) synthetase TilS n=1 Tax=Specibacter cremeus TaxID=1629051 RepID=UPI000F7A01B7|nr:tRNA lysidine(34) synthetase TilS [Specibacter cremeus]
MPDPLRPPGRLNPTVGKARKLVGNLLGLATTGRHRPAANPAVVPPLVLVACSGGPDSLALAAVLAFFARRGEIRAGAVVVDHGLQPGSADVAARAADQLRGLGLDPVQVRAVVVADDGDGPESAARTARFGALGEAARDLGARTVLLGHTLDDQAESVLLGLARGSGTRSLAGIRERRGIYLRPFLALRRTETEEICAALGLAPWHDPANTDPAYLRSRVRHEILPYLEERLAPGIAANLARTATILAQDADHLDALADAEFTRLAEIVPDEVRLPAASLGELAPALRHRVMARAVVVLGGRQPSQERLRAAAALLARRGSAGPVQMAGHVHAYRIPRSKAVQQDGAGYGKLVFRRAP